MVEDDHAIFAGCEINEAAQPKILNQRAVAVQENERHARAALHIMKAHAAHFDEAPRRWIPALRLQRAELNIGGGRSQTQSRGCAGSHARASPRLWAGRDGRRWHVF
jgi:hypothetical protein